MMVEKIFLGQLLSKYLHCMETSGNGASVRLTKSVFIRIGVPALGGKEPEGSRATVEEIAKAFQFLDSIPAAEIHSLQHSVDAWLSSKGISSQKSRSDRSRIRAFVEWVNQDNFVLPSSDALDLRVEPASVVQTAPTQEQAVETIQITRKSRNNRQNPHRFRPINRRFKSPNGTRHTYARSLHLRGKSRTDAYALGCKQFDDYVIHKGKLVLGNSRLQKGFDLVNSYQQEKLHLRPPSIKKNAYHLRCFYGWLHRHKKEPLNQLSFQKQIPVFQLYHKLENCLDEKGFPSFQVKVIREAIEKDKAKSAARELVELFKDFLKFMDGAASSECAYIGAMINVAKALYDGVTDKEQYDDFQDIPFVLQLKILRRERDIEEEPVVPREKKSLPWPRILEVMEHLRNDADTEYLEGFWGPNKSKFYSNRRKDIWIAKSLLKFLIVALFCIIPPHRSRTIQELELGETMLRGEMVDGEFVPAKFLVDNSNLGWWLYLPPEKIKTGKKYGPYWSELPNVQFADGKYFYEYIDRWLSKYRNCFSTTHKRFFTRHCGKPVTAQSLWEYHRDFFMRITEVPVSPKELRASFVTYLYDIGVPDYELDAVAFSMHHTRRMQESHYRKQKQLKRTQVAVSRSVEIVETIIGIRSSPKGLA